MNKIIMTIIIAVSCVALFSGNGETAADFLRLSISPEFAAKGQTGVSSSDGPEALNINPAGISLLDKKQVSFSYQIWFEEMIHNFVGGIYPSKYGSFALGLIFANSGDIPGYEDFLYTEDYSASDLAIQLGYSRMIKEKIHLGLTASYISEKIEDESASGISFSLGGIYKLDEETKTNIGLALRNIGSEIKFIDKGDPLPTLVEAGISRMMRFNDFGVNGNLAIEQVFKEDIDFKIGSEVDYKEMFFARLGYRSKYSLTTGIGIKWKKFTFDYAFVPYEDLDSTNHLGVSLEF